MKNDRKVTLKSTWNLLMLMRVINETGYYEKFLAKFGLLICIRWVMSNAK